MTGHPSLVGIVVPIRGFVTGKARLASRLDAPARAALARRCAERVVAAAVPHRVVVVSSAPEVCEWAAASSLDRIDDPGTLDDAAAAGRAHLQADGHARIVVAHADLPRVTTFAPVLESAAVPVADSVAVLVPCHRHDGTPVLSIPADADFHFSYGPGSFRRHVTAAERAGLTVRIVDDSDLAFDIDVPEDLGPEELGDATIETTTIKTVPR